MRALADMTAAAGRDHLHITSDLCELLFSSYGRHDEAIEQMEAEVRAYDQAHDGHWPYEDDDALRKLRWPARRGPAVRRRREPCCKSISLSRSILSKKPGSKIGYRSLTTMRSSKTARCRSAKATSCYWRSSRRRTAGSIRPTMRTSDTALSTALTNTLEIAHRHNLADAADQVRKFAFETVPAVLKRQQAQYQNTATAPLRVVEPTLGPKAALRYVVERMEQYPAWLELGWNNGWQTFGDELGRLRETAEAAKANIEDLEPRVLKLAIRELKRDLLTQDRRNPEIYYRNYQHFWAAKAGDFAAAANEVYREHKSSGRRVVYIAGYLWGGLELHARAIEIMLDAYNDGVLDESGRCSWSIICTREPLRRVDRHSRAGRQGPSRRHAISHAADGGLLPHAAARSA